MEFWPHQCIITPYTRYERKEVLRVRECRQTVVIHPIEGTFDIDTCKWNCDSKPSLNSGITWSDYITSLPYDKYYPCIPDDGICADDYGNLMLIPKNYKPRDTLAEQEAEELRLKQENHRIYLIREQERLAQLRLNAILNTPISNPVIPEPIKNANAQCSLSEAAAKKRQGQNW